MNPSTIPLDIAALLAGDNLAKRMATYENSEASNDALHGEFTRRTDSIPFLKSHRDWVESQSWGFGDRAFHYLWLLILEHLSVNGSSPASLLEIGVYKGQIISLWTLCAQHLDFEIDTYAISPFTGTIPRHRIFRVLRRVLLPSYRRMAAEGNLYLEADYLAACHTIFKHFNLPTNNLHTIRGSSADLKIHAQVQHEQFSVVYIDGDHSLKGAQTDIRLYSPLVKPGGLLIMDDASCNLPGKHFWKGHPAVSQAAEIIPSLGFKNVLNIGHNRVYLRV